jgi:S1-C subfamily serine protease
MNMIRRRAFFAAALCLALLSPASLLAKVNTYWYQPHYMAKVEDAYSRLQFLSPHFAPGNWFGGPSPTSTFALTNVSKSDLGINLFFTESGVDVKSPGLLSLTTVKVPYKRDSVISIVYADIDFFMIRSATRDNSATPWCVVPSGRNNASSNIICLPSEEDAHQVVDALSTLAVAYGNNVGTSFSMALGAMTDKGQRKHPGQTGCLVSEVDADGPAEKAGLQENDIVHTVNGQACSQQAFRAAIYEVTAKPEGGVVRAEILRKSGPLTVDLRYPHVEAPAAQLRQQVADLARRNAAPEAAAPSQGAAVAAPPSGVHFGFNIRPVNQDDVAALALTKAQGVVVISVDKASLGETMGILPGDVILAVNGAEIGDLKQFAQTLRSGAATSFRVWRKGKTLELAVPMSM